jgi:hypothetical protein
MFLKNRVCDRNYLVCNRLQPQWREYCVDSWEGGREARLWRPALFFAEDRRRFTQWRVPNGAPMAP